MSTNENSIAFSEALDVLQHSEMDIIEKIPLEVIRMIKEKSSKEYISKIDNIDNVSISRKAQSILAAIYEDYICNEEEKEEFKLQISQNEEAYQKELKKKYNSDNIFKSGNVSEKYTTVEETAQMVKYKEPFFKRLINKIKKLMKI